MPSFNLLFQSKSSNMSYQCIVQCTTALPSCISDTDFQRFSNLCLTGCKNYNRKWSCPPFSPRYEVFSKEYKYLTVFVLSMDMNQFGHIKNNYTKIKAANIMMKSRIDKVLREKRNKYKIISTGSCRLCKTCKVVSNAPCNYPNEMAYSFEALGVDVGMLTKKVLNHELLWYTKGKLPIYTSVVAGILSNCQPDVDELISALRRLD